MLSSQLNLNAECVSPPSGLVSWWPAEGNASDIQGTNNGTFNGPVFAPGEVAQAFSFDGSGAILNYSVDGHTGTIPLVREGF